MLFSPMPGISWGGGRGPGGRFVGRAFMKSALFSTLVFVLCAVLENGNDRAEPPPDPLAN